MITDVAQKYVWRVHRLCLKKDLYNKSNFSGETILTLLIIMLIIMVPSLLLLTADLLCGVSKPASLLLRR